MAYDTEEAKLRSELAEQKRMFHQLYTVVVRSLVVLKNLARGVGLGLTYTLYGQRMALQLLAFLVAIATLQLAIDQARKTANPGVKLSEWQIF